MVENNDGVEKVQFDAEGDNTHAQNKKAKDEKVKDSGWNFFEKFRRVLGRSTNSENDLSTRFNKRLFREGTLGCNLQELKQQAVLALKKNAEIYETEGVDDVEIEEDCLERADGIRYEFSWRRAFGPILPKHWGDSTAIKEDIRFAQVLKVRLPERLIDACVSHPYLRVTKAVGLTQKLNAKQIAFIILRPDVTEDDLEEIYKAQTKLGIKSNVKDEALELALEYCGEMATRHEYFLRFLKIFNDKKLV